MPSQFRTVPKDRTRSRSAPYGPELPIATGTGSPTRVTERAQITVIPTRPCSALPLRTDDVDLVPTGRAPPFSPPRPGRRCPHTSDLSSGSRGASARRTSVGVEPSRVEFTDVTGANALWTESAASAGAVTKWSRCASRRLARVGLVMAVSSRCIRWRRARVPGRGSGSPRGRGRSGTGAGASSGRRSALRRRKTRGLGRPPGEHDSKAFGGSAARPATPFSRWGGGHG